MRKDLAASVAGGTVSRYGSVDAGCGSPRPGRLLLNDDGHVFLYLSDDLDRDDLRRYLRSYCRRGVDTVAYCVGDMSWPTFYPTRVGQPQLRYGANGRDTRIHTVALGPYLEYAVALRPEQLRQGENVLEVTLIRLAPELTPEIRLVEIELRVDYGRG